MGLIGGMALSGGASALAAEGNQLQAHSFRMDELDAERAAWVQRIATMNQGRTDTQALRNQGNLAVQGLKNDAGGGGEDFHVDFGGTPAAAGSAAPAPGPATPMVAGATAPVPTPPAMPTTLSAAAPQGVGATGAAPTATDPGPSAAPAPSPATAPVPIITPPGGAAPSAAPVPDLTATPAYQSAPAPKTPAAARQQVSDLMTQAGFDDAHTRAIFQHGANAILNSKEPWRIKDYMSGVAQFSAAVESGDMKTAANIGLSMGDKGYIEANDATTVVNKLDGTATSTPYGVAMANASQTKADASSARADRPVADRDRTETKAALDDAVKRKADILGVYAKLPGGEAQFVKSNAGKPVIADLAAANARVQALQSKYDTLNGVSPAPAATAAPAAPAIAPPAPHIPPPAPFKEM